MSISKNSQTEVISKIEEKIKKLNQNNDWSKVLTPWLRTELTYTSNSLEGNTLTLIEISLIINDNQSVAGKNLREIYEAQNHAKAFDFLCENLISKQTRDLDEKDLLDIHSLILKNIDEINDGKYRNVAVRIAGSNSIFPNPLKVSDLMSEVFIWLKKQSLESLENILKTSILTHLKIVKIHPFTDGNGRTTRLFMNTILMQNQLPPIDILPKNRKEYLQSLEESTETETSKFMDFCLSEYEQNLDTYLETFTN
jgi:Fic family protein